LGVPLQQPIEIAPYRFNSAIDFWHRNTRSVGRPNIGQQDGFLASKLALEGVARLLRFAILELSLVEQCRYFAQPSEIVLTPRIIRSEVPDLEFFNTIFGFFELPLVDLNLSLDKFLCRIRILALVPQIRFNENRHE